MKIGIVGNLAKIKDEQVIIRLAERLQNSGFEVVRFASYSAIDEVSAVIVLGGDGAMLHAATVAAPKGIRVVGINYGNVGFLTEFEKNELDEVVPLLEEFRAGKARILNRSILKATVDGVEYYALNEVALQRDYASGILDNPQILKLLANFEITRKGRRGGNSYCRRRRFVGYADGLDGVFVIGWRRNRSPRSTRRFIDAYLCLFNECTSYGVFGRGRVLF